MEEETITVETVVEEEINKGEGEMQITVEEVLAFFKEAEEAMSEEEAIEAGVSLLEEEVLCHVEEVGVYPNLVQLQLVQR